MQGKVFNFIPQQERAPFWAPSKVGSGLIAHMEQLMAFLLGEGAENRGDAWVIFRPFEGGGAVSGI